MKLEFGRLEKLYTLDIGWYGMIQDKVSEWVLLTFKNRESYM
jgi:hypothetical protein